MATKDGRSQIWYADGNGNVEGYTETTDNSIETIIGTYNEHFGTNIQIWTPETKTLQVGDTVPNWNAYEKIEGGGDTPFFAIEYKAGQFVFGHADEDEIFLATKDGFYEIWYADENGVITGNYPHAAMADAIVDIYNEHFGTNINDWESEKITLQVGDTVTNWNAYEKIMQ